MVRWIRRRWLGVVVVVVALVLTAGVAGYRYVEHVRNLVCGGVGLDGPEAQTPNDALGAYFDELATRRHLQVDRSAWGETDDFRDATDSVNYESSDGLDGGFHVIFVRHRADGRWAVDGAC